MKKKKRSLSQDGKKGGNAGASSSSGSNTYDDSKTKKKKRSDVVVSVVSLPVEVLDHLVLFLDTGSSLALMTTCKTLHDKMVSSERFWMQLCRKEGFDKHREVLLQDYEDDEGEDVEDEEDDEDDDEANEEEEVKDEEDDDDKNSAEDEEEEAEAEEDVENSEEDEEDEAEEEEESSDDDSDDYWDWEHFWDSEEEEDDQENVVPVEQKRSVARMSDLRDADDDHQPAAAVVSSRKVFLRGLQLRRNICAGRFKSLQVDFPEDTIYPFVPVSCWSDDLLVVFLKSAASGLIGSLFVWKWDSFRNPTFLYSCHGVQDKLFPLESNILSTVMYLHGKYLVMAQRGYPDLIKILDMSDSSLTMTGSFGSPDKTSQTSLCDDQHLRRVGKEDKAMLFYRAKGKPLKLFVFGVPGCELLVEVEVPGSFGIRATFRSATRRNQSAFFFLRDQKSQQESKGNKKKIVIGQKILFVDFDDFVKDRGGPVALTMQQEFEIFNGDDYVCDFDILEGNRIVCVHNSGKFTVREVREGSSSHEVVLTIPSSIDMRSVSPGSLQVTSSEGGGGGGDLFALTAYCNRGGWSVFVYSVAAGSLVYSHRRLVAGRFGFDGFGSRISVSLSDDFLVIAKGKKVAFWKAKSGKFVRSFALRESDDDEDDEPDTFKFAGHGLVSYPRHLGWKSKKGPRVAADIMLFI